MIYYLAALLLGPVFYLQGRHIRRVTPKLPEPVGARAGQAGAGHPLSVLIVGDSAAAGVGVEHQRNALSGCLVSELSKTHAVSWRLMASSGDTSAQLLACLQQAPSDNFETVVVSIGVNDVTALTAGAKWVGNLEAIIETLRNRFAAQRIYLSSVPPMHEFPALPQPLRWWLGVRARQLNKLMHKVAGRYPYCEYVRVPYVSDHRYIAADGFHPGAQAYELWGGHVAALIQAATAAQPVN